MLSNMKHGAAPVRAGNPGYSAIRLFSWGRWCGHLSQPKDGGGECDDGEVVACGLLEAGGDAPELLEPGETAFDEVALGVELLVERVLAGARWVAGNDGESALVGDDPAKGVCVISGVGHDDARGQVLDQHGGLGCVPHLAGGEVEAHGAAQAADGEMNLRAQASSGAADGLIFRPPFFAPAAC